MARTISLGASAALVGRWLATAGLVLVAGCQTPAQTPPTQVVLSPPAAPTSPPPAASASRVETLVAANTAFNSGDLATAAGLYERVVNTPPGPSEAAATAAAINDFADFRAMVSLLGAGREDDARTHLDNLQQRDPSAPFARLGSQLWDQYGMIGQLRGACAQLQPQIGTQAGAVLGTLQSVGVSVDAASLCTTRQGGGP